MKTSATLPGQQPPPGALFCNLSKGFVAWVDEADYPNLAVFKWSALNSRGRFYAVRGRPRPGVGLILMHREILPPPSLGFEVDHIEHRPEIRVVDNRRINLRLATRSFNNANARKRAGSRSLYKGVYLHACGKWCARIRLDGRTYSLGLHFAETDAAHAYDRAAREMFGSFARCNFPEGEAR